MDPSIVDNRDGEDGAAMAQRLWEEMERDRARADAARTRTAADRFRQGVVEVDRAADAEAVLMDAKKKDKLDEFFSQDANVLHEMRLAESTRFMHDIFLNVYAVG